MRLSDHLKLDKSDIISFVGAGGKTTMMFKLAEELRGHNKVLVTTTTKIYIPSNDEYDFICTDSERIPKYNHMKENGIYILGAGVNDKHKILGLGFSELDDLSPQFDYILIEADGSKEKKIKGWNEFEPVIYTKTSKTVGIMDIQSIEMAINEDNVHRSEIFREITGAKEEDKVKLEHLVRLILHPQGLFKDAKGEKILYINKVETTNDLIFAKALVNQVNLKQQKLIDSVFIGSLKTDVYYSNQ